MTGTLYIVATPIGNLEDITARAVRVLGEVSLIAAEDTRHSRVLLAHFNIKTPMFSCHKFNEGKRAGFFVSALKEGRSAALISDAGTPCISDPGHRLVKAAAEAGASVVPVCGASAAIAALSVSGFDVSRFTFLGFLGKNTVKNLAEALGQGYSVVFYESPRRVASVLGHIRENFPLAQICLCNDLTKKFERVYRGTADEILKELSDNPSAEKGEYTCVINMPSGPETEDEPPEAPSVEAKLVDIMVKLDCGLKDAMDELKKREKLAKKEIYSGMLRLKELFRDD